MKKTLSLLLSLVLMLSLALPASAAETEYPTLEGGVTEIQKYGNIVLDIDPADLKDGGYTYGDLLTVTVNGTGYDMPLCTNYSDVDTGALVLRDSEGVLIAAINMGDFAQRPGRQGHRRGRLLHLGVPRGPVPGEHHRLHLHEGAGRLL